MLSKLVRTFTSDQLLLQGLLHAPDHTAGIRRLVLHVHGSYGNFYENLFLEDMARDYTATGTAFLAVNTRGHDYYSDLRIRRADGYDTRRIGGIREKFEECLLDIRAWLDFAAGEGFRSLLLQGHSLGAMKSVFYGALGRDERVLALFLISPPDISGAIAKGTGSPIESNLVLARELAARVPDALMPDGSSFDPISADAYISLFEDRDKTGMFSFHDRSLLKNPLLASVRVPVYSVVGSKDEYVTEDAGECMGLLKQALKSAPQFSGKVIPGANHTYDGHEAELSALLAGWAQAY